MAKMRTIKPELLTDEKIMFLSDSAFRLFIALFIISDDSGVHPYALHTFKAQVFPLSRTNQTKIKRIIDELSTAELIICYQVGQKKYIRVKNFTKHQFIAPKRRSYRYPLENGKIPKKTEETSTYQNKSSAEAVPKQCHSTDETVRVPWHGVIDNRSIENRNIEGGNARARDNPPTEILYKILTAEGKHFNLDRGAVDAYVDRFPNLNVAQSLAKIEGHAAAVSRERRWKFSSVLEKINHWLADDDRKVVV